MYDSLIAKVTAYGGDRGEALRRARRAIGEFDIQGVATNLRYLKTVLANPAFAAGHYDLDTRFE